MTHKWTEFDEAYVLKHYALAGAEQCARILGIPVSAVKKRAQKLKAASRTVHVDADVLKLAARPQGVRGVDLPCDKRNVSRSFKRLMAADPPLIRVQVRHKEVVYFVHQKDADACKPVSGVTIRSHHKQKGWGPNDPVYIDPEHPPKYTYAPKPVPCLRTNTHGTMG